MTSNERSFYDRVYASAISYRRQPLALIATCVLCDERTESMSLHKMDPTPRHKPECPLATPPVETTARREYHARGTYWSGVPTEDMPCDFCAGPFVVHDPRTHACPPEKSNGDPFCSRIDKQEPLK